jgi:site-specific DNA recombinase
MNQLIEKTEQDIWKEIESGKYRACYLIYNRKSTDEPDNQKNSIKYQKSENTRFGFKEHLPIAQISVKGFCLDGIISEKHSGFKDHSELVFGKDATVQYRIDRPKFYNLVQFLSKGYFKGVIVLCWDRASRNKGDNTIIEKLMKQGVDFRFTLASYDKTSSGALHMDIDGMFAQHHSRVTSEKVTLTIKNQREKGICTYKAPVGYLNLGTMENKPFDQVRAPIIKQLFEMYATGEWSLADAAKWANSQGMDMPPVRRRRTEEEILAEEEDDLLLEVMAVSRPVTVNNVHKILTNRFYTGRILGNDGTYVLSASHIPLVSDELFSKTQVALNKNNVSIHYMNTLKSQYRGLVHCLYCHRIYTPYEKKGIMYYGARCTANCPNQKKHVNISFIEKSVAGLIQNFRFTENELKELDERTQTDVSIFEKNRTKKIEVIDRKKRKIREDLTYLRDNKLVLLRAGVYSPDTYLEEEQKLNFDLTTLQNDEQISDVSMHEVIKDVIELSELLKTLCFCYENAISNEKEEITRKLFSELLLSENGLEYKVKTGLEALNTRFIPLGDPTGWISELFHAHNKISPTIHLIKSILK